MAAQRTSRKVPLSEIIFTVGVWTLAVASNIAKANKAAAATVTVAYIPLHHDPAETPTARARDIKSIDIEYVVTTADMTSAPTAVLSRVTMAEATGVRTRATITQTLVFAGTNTVGSAQGTYVATITPSADLRWENNEELWVEFTFNEAATSVLALGMVRVNLR